MKRVVLLFAAALSACAQTGVSNAGSVVAPLDLVLADVPGPGRMLAQFVADAGIPASAVFVTSTDSSELRVFETYRLSNGVSNTDWARAPDPLETLSIPVTDWADTLAIDEGRATTDVARSDLPLRRTGTYLYAARRGGSELSVVSIRERRSVLTRATLPAPMSAMLAWMDLESSPIPGEIPKDTTLYLATWDGSTGRIFTSTIDTKLGLTQDSALSFDQIAAFPGESIQAMQIVPSNPDRTLDGAPFCATTTCLAFSTRSAAGYRTELVDLSTNATASLDFGGGVREFAISMSPGGDLRLYGVLDEERCGGAAACGGVMIVNVLTGTGGVFPRSTDLQNLPMEPIRVGAGLVTGLSVGFLGAIRTGTEVVTDAGSTESVEYKGFEELGAFSSSNGYVTYFDPRAGLIIDYTAARANIEQGVLRRPGELPDGGLALIDQDGGILGTQELATLAWDNYLIAPDHTLPWRDITVTASGLDWQAEVFDGYLGTQLIYVIAHGTIAGLTGQGSIDADGTHLPVSSGLEGRALVGDVARFYTGDSTNGYHECGRATVTAIGAGFIDVDAAPCTNRVYFDIAAGPTQPLVLSGDVEGFMARGEPGTTMTYERRLLVAPRYVDRVDTFDDAGTPISFAPRTAFKLTTPAQTPLEEGAAMTFDLKGYETPYRVGLDVVTAGACYITSTTPSQVEIGPIVMGYTPWYQASSLDPQYRWATVGTVPSGNAIVRMWQDQTYSGLAGLNYGAYCYQ